MGPGKGPHFVRGCQILQHYLSTEASMQKGVQESHILQLRLLPHRCAHLQLTDSKVWPEPCFAIKSEGMWVSLKSDGENSPAQISSWSQTLVSCNHIQYSIIIFRFNYSTFGIAVGKIPQSSSFTTEKLFGLWFTVCPGPHSLHAEGFRQRLFTSEDKPD